ncbi:MAG: SsrA-binding protein SmpB [Verrucomicrobia bacterium]|nr:SsrA-binding protein SmpB [Verrucomicrobiota bacterium]
MSAEIATNRRAFHQYQILDKIEAGIELQGTEVKSIRAGLVNLNNAFARVENNEVFLYDADIQPYERASHTQHEPRRRRKLLLHKSEIAKLFASSSVGGQTLVALRLYWKNSRVKLEIGVGKGKSNLDKRHELKEKAVRRETDRTMASFNRKHG